jgi:hypothetical protein
MSIDSLDKNNESILSFTLWNLVKAGIMINIDAIRQPDATKLLFRHFIAFLRFIQY